MARRTTPLKMNDDQLQEFGKVLQGLSRSDRGFGQSVRRTISNDVVRPLVPKVQRAASGSRDMFARAAAARTNATVKARVASKPTLTAGGGNSVGGRITMGSEFGGSRGKARNRQRVSVYAVPARRGGSVAAYTRRNGTRVNGYQRGSSRAGGQMARRTTTGFGYYTKRTVETPFVGHWFWPTVREAMPEVVEAAWKAMQQRLMEMDRRAAIAELPGFLRGGR